MTLAAASRCPLVPTSQYLVSRLWFEPRITVAAFHPSSGLVSWVRWCTSLEAALHSLPEFVESRCFCPAINHLYKNISILLYFAPLVGMI